MGNGRFDDQPQWYIALPRLGADMQQAGTRVVVACGQRALWQRVGAEISPDEKAGWWPIGSQDGTIPLSECFEYLLLAREGYGADYNKLLLELSRVPAFAEFLYKAKNNLCNFVSNPLDASPLPREPYSQEALARLAQRVEETLGVESSDWWQ